MPRTDGTDDKRWYNLHVHCIYQSLTDTLCPGQIIKCDWLWLEWTKMKSISKICFFSKAVAKSSDRVPSTQSYHSLQNFKVVLLSWRATGRPAVPVQQQVMTADMNSEMQSLSILQWWQQCLSPPILTSGSYCPEKATRDSDDSAPAISLPYMLE